MNHFNAEDFWHFSCREYEKFDQFDGENPLLELQNSQQKNVNICLLLMYLDTLELIVTTNDIIKLQLATNNFQTDYLSPLRKLRELLKNRDSQLTHFTEIKISLTKVELAMEKQQQAQLIEALNKLAPEKATTPNNLALYLSDIELTQLAKN